MDAYCAEVRKLKKHFQGLEILHAPKITWMLIDAFIALQQQKF
jgi:hypothetical protein